MCNKIRHIEDVPLSTVAISLEHTHFTQWVCLCINTSSFLLQFNEDCDLLFFEVKEASDKVVLYLHLFVISMDVLSNFFGWRCKFKAIWQEHGAYPFKH